MNEQATKAYLTGRDVIDDNGQLFDLGEAFVIITDLVAALESVDEERQELCKAAWRATHWLRNDAYDTRVSNARNELDEALESQEWDEDGTDE